MKTIVTYAALALLIFGGGYSTMQSSAHAQNLELELGQNGPKLRLRDGDCDPRRERCRDDNRRGLRDGDRRGRRDDNDGPRDGRRVCSDDRALDKAERLGIRRARIVDSNRRSVDIRGRDRDGDRVELTIGRDRSCPVLR